jgi:predicted metal-binding membrane protein
MLVLLTAAAWLALTIWSLSPYARYLNHEILEHVPFTLRTEYFTLLSVFIIGWLLMTIAMMLPTSLPLVMHFLHLTRQRPDHLRLVMLLIAGYLGVWTAFGGLAHVSDFFVHKATHRFAWLEANA